jgi:hypothetical protein
MQYNYSNYTQFGIKNVTERYTYAAWLITLVISSLLGDTIILVASIKYKAFDLHKIVVAFIQHTAVCNLLISIAHLLPCIVSLITNSGPTDNVQIYIKFCLNYYFNTVSMLLTCVMALMKLLRLKNPFKTRTWSTKQAHKACIAIWLVSLYVPILHLIADKDDVIFDFRLYVSAHGYSSDIWKILLPISSIFSIIMPNLVMVVSTAILLKEAKKLANEAERSLRWQGIITVLVSAMVYMISLLPFTIYCLAEPWVKKDAITPGTFHKQYYRVACAIINMNILANFFICGLTVTSFRIFLQSKFYQILSCLSGREFSRGKIILNRRSYIIKYQYYRFV